MDLKCDDENGENVIFWILNSEDDTEWGCLEYMFEKRRHESGVNIQNHCGYTPLITLVQKCAQNPLHKHHIKTVQFTSHLSSHHMSVVYVLFLCVCVFS